MADYIDDSLSFSCVRTKELKPKTVRTTTSPCNIEVCLKRLDHPRQRYATIFVGNRDTKFLETKCHRPKRPNGVLRGAKHQAVW